MKRRILDYLLSLLESPQYRVSEEKKIIDSFPDPKDDYDRTYYNYKCVTYGRSKTSIYIFDFFSLLVILLMLFVYFVNRIIYALCKRKDGEKVDGVIIHSDNRVGVHYSYEGRIPQSIYDEYSRIKELNLKRFPKFMEGVLGYKALLIWLRFVIKHPLSGFVNLRALINLMGIYKIIVEFAPRAIIISRAELNGMSSLTTCFCEKLGIKYINFMHGESMAEISIAFVRFSRFFIWDEGYKDVFLWARCEEKQFKVYTPGIYKIQSSSFYPIRYNILYVFGGNEKTGKDENAEKVKDILVILSKSGKKCKVRPHPRWSDLQYIRDVFNDTEIDVENPREIKTSVSIQETEMIVGLFSTVLAEAFYANKRIVIDNISDPEAFEELKEKKYIMLKKQHVLLSQIMEE